MSIYEFLLNKFNSGEPYADALLPDHEDMNLPEGQEWVPGAFEGTILRGNYGIKQHLLVNYKIARTIRKQIEKPCDANREKAETSIRKYAAITIIDPVLSIMLSRFRIDKEKMRTEALRMMTESDKREIVKFGIALWGHCGREEDVDIIKVLGRHEEFSLYCAGAIHVKMPGAGGNEVLIYLSENLKGWGKIAVAYEFDYTQIEARYYTVAEGCENTIGLSYLSNVCATKGKMTEIMQEMLDGKEEFGKYSDKQMFKGICDIFTGLQENHATNDDMSNYKHSKKAARLFKDISEKYPELAASDDRTEKIISELRYFLM